MQTYILLGTDYRLFKGEIYVETGKHSKKMENLSRNNTIYFCIDDPNPPYKGVRGKGSAMVHENVNFNILIAQKIHLRYFGNLEHPIAHELVEAIKNGQSISMEIIENITQLGITVNSNSSSSSHRFYILFCGFLKSPFTIILEDR